MRAWVLAAILAVLLVTSRGLGEEFSPHRMVGPDGELDMSACSFCHEEDLQLARSKEDVCTMCHSRFPHSGAAEHLRASPASVARLLPSPQGDVPALPLIDDGRLYCGSCHLFHDPAIGGETPLAKAWVPAATGPAEAIRSAVAAQWAGIARKYGESTPGTRFDTKGTKALRLPVEDGSLCRHCHGSMVE